MTKVIHISNAPHGWRRNEQYVYIGRPSKWGNPFKVDKHGREKSVELYEKWVKCRPALNGAINELKDKTLVCYCSPEKCHGDILADMANNYKDNDV